MKMNNYKYWQFCPRPWPRFSSWSSLCFEV